jgi:hypothetical protein
MTASAIFVDGLSGGSICNAVSRRLALKKKKKKNKTKEKRKEAAEEKEIPPPMPCQSLILEQGVQASS